MCPVEIQFKTAMISSKAGKQRNKIISLNETLSKVPNANVSYNKNTQQKENTIVEKQSTTK